MDILESVMVITEEDPLLIWRQRPLLSTTFQGAKLKTNSLGLRGRRLDIGKIPPETKRIFCLGDSFTFGWGVEADDAYPFALESFLNKNGGGKKNFEVVNAGEVGFTSYQGTLFLENRLLAYSPDILIISYGFNDVDRYRFYMNNGAEDMALRQTGGPLLYARNLIKRSRLYMLFRRGVFWLLSRNGQLYSLFLEKELSLSRARVNAADYESNLRRMIETGIANKCKIILMSVPLNLPLPTLSDNEKKLLQDQRSLSAYYCRIGREYEKREEYAAAQSFLKKAKKYLVFDCVRDNQLYQKIITKLATEYRIPIVDVDKLFKESHGIEGLFNGANDPIHASALGHRIIAKKLYDIISSGSF